jgi:hypothetical protein
MYLVRKIKQNEDDCSTVEFFEIKNDWNKQINALIARPSKLITEEVTMKE